ncbi:type IV secretory system conjugative DNA transfer family protein [Xenorhabdus bovienii]|uniref:type IV secretory system conjugative DNA transfer family protein n=1 Tax=Xenorhabdus bovienii TaxID=40576 RepID=UPI00237C9AE0|nr:type IV secretory system conjugative DNA transfer family protein [Xenorhabdus bovienii]MDE1475894.1 type IV secretory system conjugative DNA transfer family protein [Xenorhabdus bovienii]
MSGTNSSITKLRLIGGFYLVLFIIGMNSVCTQFIAHRLDYHPALGHPLFGTLYSPFDWWRWMFRFYDATPTLYNTAFIIFTVGILIAFVTFVLWVGLKSRSSRKHEDVHGTAHFARLEEVKKTGLLPRDGQQGRGVYCGAYDDTDTGRTYYLRHDGAEHICAVAPTRSGKGVGLVIPTLLSWPHSVFVLDRKGENYAMTSGWRKHYAKTVVLRFDPAKPHTGCAWNPLDEISFRTRFQVSDTQNIALMVVDSDGKGIESDHFRSAAFELLVGLILHALYKGERVGRPPCLQDIGHMLTGVGDFAASDTQNDLADDMDGDPKALSGLFDEMRNVRLQKTDPADREAQLVITGIGTRMINTPARELGSIISTANNALALYRDPIVGENTSRSDFKIADLMDHDRPVSLYLISTPKTSKRLVPLTRLLLTMIVLTLADEMEFDDGRAKTVHKHRLLLMLDEFPTLGKLDVFEEALSYIAGYDIKAYLITQDVKQLYKAYTNYESIVSNCHVRIAYAPNNLETAEWMSKMTGTTTVVKEHVSTSGKRFGMVLDHVSRNYQEVQRPLMTPDEIMRLPGPTKDISGEKITAPGEMLVFVAGQPVIRGRQILYFSDPVFCERSKIKPVPSDSVREKLEPKTTGGGFVIS